MQIFRSYPVLSPHWVGYCQSGYNLTGGHDCRVSAMRRHSRGIVFCGRWLHFPVVRYGLQSKMKTGMRNALKLDRVETNYGVFKIEGEIHGTELVVQNLWAMSTDGWEEIDLKCTWARTMLNASTDILVGRIIEKYDLNSEQITRVVGS